MDHRISEEDVERAMHEANVMIASSSSAAGSKRLIYNHGRALYVLTVNNEFRYETSDAKDAAYSYSEVQK